jgi:hypothetical protein
MGNNREGCESEGASVIRLTREVLPANARLDREIGKAIAEVVTSKLIETKRTFQFKLNCPSSCYILKNALTLRGCVREDLLQRLKSWTRSNENNSRVHPHVCSVRLGPIDEQWRLGLSSEVGGHVAHRLVVRGRLRKRDTSFRSLRE